jgi:bifunctional DNA-binding transcriptional regulator/antitoxin component of YhaV-PrlF toxin-antitoxin module
MKRSRQAILSQQAERRAKVYLRWKRGDRVEIIAADEGITSARVYDILSRCKFDERHTMNRTREAVIPSTGTRYPTRSMSSVIEQAMDSGADDSDIFPFG